MREAFPLIEPKFTEPYYRKPVKPIEPNEEALTNKFRPMYRALLHQLVEAIEQGRVPSTTNWSPKCTEPY